MRSRIVVLSVVVAAGIAWSFGACARGGDEEYRHPWDGGGTGGGDGAADDAKHAPVDAKDAPADAPFEVSLSDSGLPAEHAWLADPIIWKPAPGNGAWAPKCAVFEGVSALLKFPSLTWEACGPGCAQMDVTAGFGKVSYPTLSTPLLPEGPVAFLQIEVGVETESHWFIPRRIVSLSNGATIAAVLRQVTKAPGYATCVFGNARDDAFSNLVAGNSQELPFTWLPDEKAWRWATPPLSGLPQGRMEFTMDSSTPIRIKTGKGAVFALLDVAKNVWTLLESNSHSQLGGGQGDLAVWTDYPNASSERIRGWSPDGKGVRTLIESVPTDTCWVGVSPTDIVGLAASACKLFGDLRFWRAPRSKDTIAFPPSVSPTLDYGANWAVRTWGGYAGTVLYKPDDAGAFSKTNSLVLVQLSTWKAWRIEPTPGSYFDQDTWSLTDTAVYLGEQKIGASSMGLALVKRIDLSMLDLVATPLG
ncbi:MAG: hypothetical protein HS104_11305 [Polyangiaceae bacterium]|nr:hypothetical protein [Polyangiaceae bacterium]MCE7891698.1 hypothetical protein [Sorangiineae bacterium PRO1]MCL4748625.1 hypothetical protein [Myxococcales bacterium]